MAKASETSNAAIQYLLAQKQTAAENGDTAAADAIAQQIADLGYT